MNKKIIITLFVQIVLIGLIYGMLGLSSQGVIALILTSSIALTLIIAFHFEPSKRKDETKIKSKNATFISNELKTCYICDTKNKKTAEFCIKCGTSLKSITCPVCNQVNVFDQKYCIKCETILQNKNRH